MKLQKAFNLTQMIISKINDFEKFQTSTPSSHEPLSTINKTHSHRFGSYDGLIMQVILVFYEHS